MDKYKMIQELAIKTESKIILCVLDGLGGLPYKGRTTLEAAHKPNLDKLAYEGICGLADIVDYGITPGSGPGHLALFGYEPTEYEIGRGVLSALGIDFDLRVHDVAARGNFATINAQGRIIDRRAGRISTEKCSELCERIQKEVMMIETTQIIISPEKDYRFVLILRGVNLSSSVSDTDPLILGEPPLRVQSLDPEGVMTADIVGEFVRRANELISNEPAANTVLLRGLAKKPAIPTLNNIYKLTPVAIATYPMYRGIAKLVGMHVPKIEDSLEAEFKTLEECYKSYDFIYFHVKRTDSYGEDGNFDAKAKVIEKFDSMLEKILDLNPDVIVVTGDHSTPATLKSHSWHPVPFLLWSKNERKDRLVNFSEQECTKGSLSRFPMKKGMNLMMASALKYKKYGA